MTHDDLFQRMMRRIDHQEMYAIHQRYPRAMWDKFFDVAEYTSRGAGHAVRLSEHIPENSRCLDLGTAFGYVSLGLTELGHEAICVDQGFDILREVAGAIPAGTWEFARITPDYKPEGKFNLIFAHGLIPLRNSPDWREGPGLWTEDDYATFAGNLCDALNPGGFMEWIINRGEEAQPAYSRATWDRLKTEKRITFMIEDNVITAYKLADVPQEATACAAS
jgi:hypothetical protein